MMIIKEKSYNKTFLLTSKQRGPQDYPLSVNKMKIRDFIEAIQKAEYAEGQGTLELMIKYTWSEEILDHQFPLPKGNYIDDTGLKDPGFGPGPTLFNEIELIIIKTKTSHQKNNKAYEEKVNLLKQLIVNFENVSINDNYIEYKNINT